MIPATLALLFLSAQASAPSAPPPMQQNRAPVDAEPAPSNEPQSPDVDRLFASVAIQGNDAEIEMAKLALERGSADEVKHFAEKMIAEHTGLKKEIMPILQRISSGQAPQNMSPADELVLRHLKAVKPADFDQLYILNQIAGHLQMLSAFQAEADNGTDQELKQAVRNWMPTILAHLQLAVDTVKHIGGSSPFKQ